MDLGQDYDLDKVSKTKPLSFEIARIMGRLDPDGEMVDAGHLLSSVQRAWEEVAGEHVAKITRSVYVRNNEIVVVLSSPIWAQELGFLSSKYCEELNRVLQTDFEKIVFLSR